MKPIIYSYDINHILHWEKMLSQSELIDDIEKLKTIENKIIILANEAGRDFVSLLQKLVDNANKILILDNTPSLPKAKAVLSLGARGYGNTLMSQIYMQSALETIKSDNIWFIPTLTKELIQSSSMAVDEKKLEKVLQNLTDKEKEIALLLKEGLYNQEIAQKLDVSINTIKSHIKNIYAKVGVKDKLSFIRMMGS